MIHQFKKILLPEHQLFLNRERLQILLQKESDWKIINRDRKLDDNEENLCGLTSDEKVERDQLYASGFPTWLKSEFLSFL